MGIPNGPAGIRTTLHLMANLASRAKTTPQVRELALSIVGLVPGKNFRGEIDRIYTWVRDSIRYTRDVRGVETIQTPAKTIEYMQGDCDDQVTLLAALLESIGIEARFKAVGFTPGHFQHVYLEARDNGEWIALDPTEQVAPGWAPPNPVSVMIEDIA
jgi:transglutaminase-like putative cysteine protease